MIHIPIEILHLIFIKVPLKDRLQCMLVCHYWNDTLNRRSLLYEISIRERQYPKFKDMIERLPYRGVQVEYLTLYSCFRPDFDKRKLCNMFPNLRELELGHINDRYPKQDYISNQFHFMYPTSKLERIADIGECELTCQLIASKLCDRLHSLELNFSDSPDSTSSDVIPRLKNMPALKNLCISNIEIKLMELEILHSNLPLIKTLQLKEITPITGDFPLDIQPAELITKLNLEIECAPELRSHIQFYRYMSKKYPSVSTFIHSDVTIKEESSEYVRVLFKKGLFPFLQKIKPHIGSFYFENYCDGMDAFKKFDAFGWKLKYLSIKSYCDETLFIEELARSEQSRHIEYIQLEDIIPRPTYMLKNMKALRTLHISCHDSYFYPEIRCPKTINLSELVENCPTTLSTLRTEHVDLTFNQSSSSSNLTFIKELDLWEIDLTPELAKIIETSFPELSSLRLHGTIKSDVTIELPNHKLKYVDVKTVYNDVLRNGFSIKTLCDDRLEYYALKGTQNANPEDCIPVSKEELTDPLILNITCVSVEELHFSSCRDLQSPLIIF